jgi:hypothetical protein
MHLYASFLQSCFPLSQRFPALRAKSPAIKGNKRYAKPFTGHAALRYALTSIRVPTLPNLSHVINEKTTRAFYTITFSKVGAQILKKASEMLHSAYIS